MKRTVVWVLPPLGMMVAVFIWLPLAHAQEGAKSLLRGPIHEGFAEPISVNPQPSVVAPRRPPELIDEAPAEMRPRDETAIWLSGYWAWDQDRDGFVWISGTWRVPPPDRRWLPGYWVEVQNGYQWVPGFWASLETEQITYLPTPPEAPQLRPTSEPPSPDYIWVNGCWLYQDGRFVWRPGYWHRADPDFVWVPSHYSWTPGGVIFVSGYWDHPLGTRGFVYAPVVFRQVAGIRYTPSVWIDVSNVAIHLFVNPRMSHYYFGDYYGDRYVREGYYPWYSFHTHRNYDPLLGYYAARYRHSNIDYVDRLRGWHQYYVTHEDVRPPRTLVDQRQFLTRIENRTDVNVTNINQTIINSSIVARPVQEALERNPRFRERSERVSQDQLQAMVRDSRDLRGLMQQRQRAESGPVAGGGADARQALRLPKVNEDLSRRVTARRMPLPDVPEQGGARGGRDVPPRPDDRRGLPDTGLPNRGDMSRGPLDRDGDKPGVRPGDPRDIGRPGLPGAGRDAPRPGFDRGGDRSPDVPGRGRGGEAPSRGRESGPSDPRGGPGLAPDARVPSRPDIRTPGGPGLLPDDANRPGPGGARSGGRERSADRDDRRTGSPPAGAVAPLAERPRVDRPAPVGRPPQPSGAAAPGVSRPEPRKVDRPAASQPSPPPAAARPDANAKPAKPDKQPGGKDKDKDKDDERKGGKGR